MNQIVYCVNNIDYLKTLSDNSIDSIVTDPPYGLGKEPNPEELLKCWLDNGYKEMVGKGFMGNEWDSFVPQPIFWKEAYRVLKPGGHVLSFFGTRTYDWGTMAMRLAGFEIRDCIMWVYGSGMPKSLNIGKFIDKRLGNSRKVIGQYIPPNGKEWNLSRDVDNGDTFTASQKRTLDVTEGESGYDGIGTGLKPAVEPIVLARKPIDEKSIADNIIVHGTGGLNIDSCRIEVAFTDDKDVDRIINRNVKVQKNGWGFNQSQSEVVTVLSSNGRWPSNFIIDESEDVAREFDKYSRTKSGKISSDKLEYESDSIFFNGVSTQINQHGDSGNVSRFFYCAKASTWERNLGLDVFDDDFELATTGKDLGCPQVYNGEQSTRKVVKKNHHPTVKPISLMQYLVRLITPKGGICLDPFAGSGTTGMACVFENVEFIGLEMSEDYTNIANSRIEYVQNNRSTLSKKISTQVDKIIPKKEQNNFF